VIPETARCKPLEIWFQDEARVGQKGTLAYVWAKLARGPRQAELGGVDSGGAEGRQGTRPRAVQDTRYISAYIYGAICPERGVGAGLVMPQANAAGLNDHLAEVEKAVTPGAHAVLILDGAGWHTSKDLTIPDNISLLKLPAYAPELNPVENVWQCLRRNKLAHRLYDT